MEDYIRTYGRKQFAPLNPKKEEIEITDIAHALSLICRGNGHVKHFFSVGQHCIHCAREAIARGYSKKICLACLLHDAAEAYLSDVPRPLKKHIPMYEIYEEKILNMVYKKYLGEFLEEEEKEVVQCVDDDMLYFDLRDLLEEPVDREEPKMKSNFSLDFVPFEEIERQYLDLFYLLSKNI